jgi:hypothetical protein
MTLYAHHVIFYIIYLVLHNIVTDLFIGLLGNGSVNKFQRATMETVEMKKKIWP